MLRNSKGYMSSRQRIRQGLRIKTQCTCENALGNEVPLPIVELRVFPAKKGNDGTAIRKVLPRI